jgi:acetylornithine deacetylase/succinyl-diaminopimelate desuccinylase-like protein
MSQQLHSQFKNLLEFLSIPSISTQPEHKDDVIKAANYLVAYTKSLGLDNSQLLSTEGYPIVYAEKIINNTLPTVLIYGHYDVQPADPIEKWSTPPFEPTIKVTPLHPEGAIFARGACDDKGQLFIPLEAYKVLTKKEEFPCNVKFIFEGEEEIGSISLPKFIKEHTALLTADALVVCDTAMIDKKTPALIYKLKGAGLIDLTVSTKNADLHSGIYGGIAPNPATELCKIIAATESYFQESLDANLYLANVDSVSTLGDALKLDKTKSTLQHSPETITQHLPTMEINGIQSGYCGKGHKTVIPSTASTKISVRSAIGESTDEILSRIKNHIIQLNAPDVEVMIKMDNLCEPIAVNTTSPEYIAAIEALCNVVGTKPKLIGIGGSIPVVKMFKDLLNMDALLMGFGLNSDNIHSPNEHFGIENFNMGTKSFVNFFQKFGSTKKNII